MNILLEKCPSCDRHVRQDEVSCPFCGVAFAASFAVRRQRPRPAGRLSRAALWALGASTVGVVPLAGCGSDDSFLAGQDASVDAAYGGPPDDRFDASPVFTGDAAYGGPPVDHFDGSPGDAADGGPMLSFDAAYGGPPPHDAGEDAGLDASDAADAD